MSEERMDNLERRMDRIIEWVKTCDNKATILLSIDALLLTLTFSSDYVLNGIQTIVASIFDKEKTSFSFSGFLCVLALVVMAISCLYSIHKCILVIKAKPEADQTNDNDVKTDSLIHFQTIAALSYNEFKSKLESEEAREDLISQIYVNAYRCREKFVDYNSGICALRVAIPATMVFILSLICYLVNNPA